jgi:peptide/nickel transport system substrate-binding protein
VNSGAMRGRRPIAVATVLVVLAVGLVWGIAGALAADDTATPAADGQLTLRLGWTADPDSLNPFIGWDSSSYEVWSLNYDLLVGFRASDLTNQPGIGLATDWETSADGKVWTFTIVEGATWQDGEPVTASDVAFTFNYVIDNEMGMFIDYMLFIDSVEAIDDTHVVFTCSKPKANMLGLWLPILPEHIWSKIDPGKAERGFKNAPPIVGSGPFQTVEFKKGEFLRMEANKNYWKGAPKIDEVIFQMYQNSDTMAQDLKAGGLASAWNIPSAQFDALDAEPNLTAIAGVVAGYDELGFNCADKEVYPKSTGHPALTDPAFRRALNWAVDRDKLVEVGYYGFASPGSTIVMPDFYDPEADYHWEPPAGDPNTYTFDLERARQELDAAGYTDGDGDGIREYDGEPIELRLAARTQSLESQNCGKFIKGWFEEIGLKIKYEVMDQDALGDKQYNYVGDEYAPDFDMFIWGWGGDIDPNFILSIMLTNSIEAWSDCMWSNAEYDALFEEQQSTIDVQERIAIVQQMQQIAYEESPYIVLAYPRNTEVYDDVNWSGWVRSGNGKGLVWFNTQMDSYLSLEPATGDEESDGGSNTALIVGIIAAVVVIGLIIVFVVRGRGGKAEEI